MNVTNNGSGVRAEQGLDRPATERPRRPRESHIYAAIGLLLGLLAVSFAVAVLLVLDFRSEQSQLQTRHVPYATAVAEAALLAKSIANDERGFLISGDEQFVRQLEGRIGEARAAFAAALRAADGRDQYETVDEAWAGFERWLQALRDELTSFQAGEREASIETALGPVRTIRKAYEADLARAQALGESAIDSGRESVADSSSRSIVLLLSGLLVTLAIGVGVAIWLARAVLRPVDELLNESAQGTERVLTGDRL
jgi:methyl-accepting chemotaxis protein